MYFRQYDRRNNYHGMYDNEEMGKTYFNTNSKGDMDNLLNSLLQNPLPLRKNLADSIIAPGEKPKKKTMLNVDMGPPKLNNNTNGVSLPTMPVMAGQMSYFGIPNIVSNLFNAVKGAVTQWRPKSPEFDFYDEPSHQRPPATWQSSNGEVQNKPAPDFHSKSKSDMNINCKLAAEQCEKKIGQLTSLLACKPTVTGKFIRRRPKRQFVEPDSVEDKFEDALSPEDIATLMLPNDAHFDCQAVYQVHEGELFETASPKVKIESKHLEDMDIIKTVPLKEEKHIESGHSDINIETVANIDLKLENQREILLKKDMGEKLVSSNETKPSKFIEIPFDNQDTGSSGKCSSRLRHLSKHIVHSTTKDKHYKNPNRTTEKRKKCKLRTSIQDDLVFANEIASEDISSVENSPSINHLDKLYKKHVANAASSPIDIKNTQTDSFDEITGRFNSTSSTNSDDAFQIVFNDSPNESRLRQFSDCESEDSFIVFDDSPEVCYTSNDVFGDSDESDSDTEYTESESDLSDTEDVPAQQLSHSLTRTCSDLTNVSLYVDNPVDVVDCAVRKVEDKSKGFSDLEKAVSGAESTGVLLNDCKKLIRKCLPPKKVQFSSKPPKVHVMRVWAFAARQARAGHWERCVIDRERFKRRIADVDLAVSWVLKPQHRSRVMFQRFMPWWNAQKRKELAEKKAKEEEEKARLETAKTSANVNDYSVDVNNGNNVDGNNDIVKNNENVYNGNDSLTIQSDIAKLNGINVDKNKDIVNGNFGKQDLNDNNGKDLDVVNKIDVLKINGVNDLSKSMLNSTLNSMTVKDKTTDLQNTT